MTDWLVPKNNASSTLVYAITAEAATLSVKSGEGSRFPSTFPFRISINDEILQVTARAGDNLTVSRAQECTSAASHASNAAVRLNVTAGIIIQLQEAMDALDTAKLANSLVDAKGDILCASADNTPARLPVGSNGQLLQVDSTEALGIKWGSISGSKITTGTYTGDSTVNRAIPHGLGETPKLVLIQQYKSGNLYNTYVQIPDVNRFKAIGGSDSGYITQMDDTNIYVGDATYYTPNASTNLYRWYAFA